MKLIPALDIMGGNVVRLTQGDYSRKTVYSEDPVSAAAIFSNAGVKRLHLVDLDGALSGKPVNHELFGKIKKQTNCIIEAGGGVRSLEDVEKYFQLGLNPEEDFIMIGSLPFTDPLSFERIREKYLKNILLTIDVWERSVRISGWTIDTNISISVFLGQMIQMGIENFLVTQIKRDGMLTGPDVNLYREINEEFLKIKVIVSGGIASLGDVKSIESLNSVCGFIVGRAYYENKITIDDIRNFHG